MNNIRRFYIVVTLVVAVVSNIYSKGVKESIESGFAKFAPSEKLYLHIDKSNYAIGDTIWFRAYLQDAISLNNAASNFIYIDLIDSRDSLILHRKIKRTDGILKGYMPLSFKVSEGDYCVRAYTNWMQNFTKNDYFYKNITVRESIQSEVKFWAEAQKTKTDTTSFTLSLGVLGGETLKRLCSNRDVSMVLDNLTTGKRKRVRGEHTNSQAEINVMTDDIHPGDVLFVRIRGEIGERKYSSYVRVRVPKKDFDIQFLPEGGNLIAGGVRRIAYKAVSSDGKAVDVKGYIVSKEGDTVSHFRSSHSGMGVVSFFAKHQGEYTAYVTTITPDSLSKRVAIPTAVSDGVSLMLYPQGNSVLYQIDKVGAFQNEELYVILHSRGCLHYVIPIEKSTISKVHRIPINPLPPGISHIMIVNSKSEPIAERLFFVDPAFFDVKTTLTVGTDKLTYGKRDKVSLLLDGNKELNGMFSVSVTDNKLVKCDSLADNIVSNLLLTSDLCGTIENPFSYIGNGNVDLLMLTNGWRKFDVENIVKSIPQDVSNYREENQLIKGKLVSNTKKYIPPYRGVMYHISGFGANAEGIDSISAVPVMKDLSFEISEIDFLYGDKKVLLHGLNPQKRWLSAEITVDKMNKPKPWTKAQLATAPPRPIRDEKRGVSNLFVDDDSMQSMLINEVLVSGKRRIEKLQFDESGAMRLSSESIYSSPFNDYVSNISEHMELKQIISSEGTKWKSVTLYIIDDIEYELSNGASMMSNDLPQIYGSDILAIEYATFPKEAIVIQTKMGSSDGYALSNSLDQFRFTYKGYERCRKEFYSPRYDVVQKSKEGYALIDNRSTIYWNPEVVIVNGVIQTPITFYTTDNLDTKFNVIVEGIDKSTNTPISSRHTITID